MLALLLLLAVPCEMQAGEKEPPAKSAWPFGPAGKEPKITMPEALATEAGVPVIVSVQTNGRIVKWVPPERFAAKPDYYMMPASTENSWYFVAPAAGLYRIGAYTALGDAPSDIVHCVVTVGKPGPGPSPVPVPVPPDPTNPLVAQLSPIYVAALETNKADLVKRIAKAHRETGARWCKDASIKTAADLQKQLKSEVALELGALDNKDAPVLNALRRKLAAIESEHLPPGLAASLSESDRADASLIFVQVADALEQLK
jgi:hypothetical protein